MNRLLGRGVLQTRPCHRVPRVQAQALHSPKPKSPPCSNTKSNPKHISSTSARPLTFSFWSSTPTWKRASLNTFRCLIGCTSGDFASLWVLQSHYADLGMGVIMPISSQSEPHTSLSSPSAHPVIVSTGLFTSITLETILLHWGKDRLPWPMSFRTAIGMSLVSMLAMEMVQNVVDYHLTGGVIAVDDPWFWAQAMVAMGAGFLAPLPYNYWRLRRYGLGCH